MVEYRKVLSQKEGKMNKQTIAVLGPGSWGTALSQVLNDNGHEVRIWGNIPDQIDEINTQHTNKHRAKFKNNRSGFWRPDKNFRKLETFYFKYNYSCGI